MKFFISWVFISCLCLLVGTQSLAGVGDVNYISDELNVPLRSGPSTAHRILHRGLPSGTKLTILGIDEEAGFTKVRTDSGLEGWVTSQYLIGEPIARVKLAAAERRLQSLKGEIEKEREVRTGLQAELKETKATNQTLISQVEALSKELAELKLVSADPIREHARNVELTQQNTRLAGQVEELSAKTRQLEENIQLKWLLYGGGLVLIGLLIGVVLKARSRPATFSRY